MKATTNFQHQSCLKNVKKKVLYISRKVKLLQWDACFSIVMDGITRGVLRLLGNKDRNKRGGGGRRIIAGLKSDSSSRDMLLRLLNSVAVQGDSVLAVHVQKSDDDTFDPNTFHIYEDLCKSKKVDFEIRITTGGCYVKELSQQVRLTFATILAIGCNNEWAKSSTVTELVKALPPTCKLLTMDDGGKILFQEMGTSQQGSTSRVSRTLKPSLSESVCSNSPRTSPPARRSLSLPSLSQEGERAKFSSCIRRFTFEDLKNATKDFGPDMLNGEISQSRVYKAVLENGRQAAVRVLKTSQHAEEVFLREVEILSGLRHENIVQLIGYCYCKEMYATVYDWLGSSLKQRLRESKWNERMRIAIGVAKALEYIHSCNPRIVHKDVNSSNILLPEDGKPLLSGFGYTKVDSSSHRSSIPKKPAHFMTFGYSAPEYLMYGKVDEKIDVYSYGVVMLELITGKEADQTSPASNEENLVVWARSLLVCGLDERLVDPNLKEDYRKDEMKVMMIVARSCLLHSSSRRPTMAAGADFALSSGAELRVRGCIKTEGSWPIQPDWSIDDVFRPPY